MISVELDGLQEMQKALEGLAKKHPAAVLQGCTKTAYRIERAAKEACPVDTGNLRSSILTTVDREAQSVMVSAGGTAVTAEVEYATYVNYGTVKMPARPFFTSAIEQVRNLPDDVAEAINQGFK